MFNLTFAAAAGRETHRWINRAQPVMHWSTWFVENHIQIPVINVATLLPKKEINASFLTFLAVL